MLWNLFNFFTDAATGTTDGTTTDGTTTGGWGTWIIFGIMMVICVVMMIVPQRKAKKAQAEMQAKIRIGATIMTAGGIIGEIIQMDSEYVWIATGLGEDKIVMQFVQRAISSVVNAPSTPAEPTADTTDDVDEIK